ncbi:MAG: tetratricopeptide repeat-containing sensor histidine kinase [Chloroherpetonaceae bacterium]|nr:tetratricopeptide repeat-containing sensor histidine kinase [Chloroherpetonaceae bacterium]
MITAAELRSRLQGADDLKSTIDDLNESVWEMSRNDPKQGLPLCQLIEKWSREANYLSGVAKALRNRALCYQRLSSYELALKDLSEAARLFRDLNDLSGEASAINTSGLIFMELGEYAKAMECFEQALPKYEQINYTIGIASSTANIGHISVISGELELALDYFKKSLNLYRSISDKRGQASVLVSIGNVYSTLNAPTEALKCFRESLALYDQTKDLQGKAVALRNVGSIYATLGEESEALSHYEQSLQMMSEIGDKRGEASVLLALANLYLKSENAAQRFERIKSHLDSALPIAEAIKAKALIYEIHRSYAEMYEQMEDYKNALYHHKLFLQVKESLISEEARKKLRNQQIAYAIEKSEKEAELYRLKNQELSEANRALKELNDLKTELMGFAAHDLKAPLQSIMTFAELIRATPDDVESVTEFANNIFVASDRMFSLVKSLLQSTAIELGKIEINAHVTNVSNIVKNAALQYAQKAVQKGQEFQSDIEENLLANIDSERFAEVLDNLVSNAIKYSPSGKKILVKCEKKPSQRLQSSNSSVLISVKDEGQGLTEDDMKKLFGRFQKLSAQPTAGEHSSGLGLYISKKYIEMMGGKIWAESEGKDKGATFFIELPSV